MTSDQKPGRLKKRSQFLHLSRRGRKAALPGMVVQGILHEEAEGGQQARVGFTVTKKVGNAVIRNRTRRRLREALRLVARDEGLPSGDFVLIGREGTRGRDFSALKNDLRQAISKVSKR